MATLPPFHIVIPARYASQRFPKKMLANLAGKPVIQWVYELALKAGAQTVTIATDHIEIMHAAKSLKASAVMTRQEHQNGTERLAEVSTIKGWAGDEIVINVQGDEPLLPISLIHDAVIALAEDLDCEMATVACPIHRAEQIFDPNVVKVVRDLKGRALYFSRAAIPWYRDGFAHGNQEVPDHYRAYRHIGLYAYRVSLLARYAKMPLSPLEKLEKLEQLRFLYHGIKVQVALSAEMPPHGIDTPADLKSLSDKLLR